MIRWQYEPWVKLYIREQGSFAALPLFTRALGAELLKICDQEGRISLHGRSAVDAIAFQLGATRGDRRQLARALPELVADGYLIEETDALRIRNFQHAQRRKKAGRDDTGSGRDGASNERPNVLEASANEPRTDHEAATNRARSSRDGVTSEPLPSTEAATQTQSSIGNDTTCLRSAETRRNETIPPLSLPERAGGNPSEQLEAKNRQRRTTMAVVIADHRALLDQLASEGIGSGGKSLQDMGVYSSSLMELLRRLEGRSPDEQLAYCRHVLEIRGAEARSSKPRSAKYCAAEVWSYEQKASIRTLAEFPPEHRSPFPWSSTSSSTAVTPDRPERWPGERDGWNDPRDHVLLLGKPYQTHRDGGQTRPLAESVVSP